MQSKIVNILGMELLEVKHKQATAHFYYDEKEKFITLYDIISDNPGQGEAQELLKEVIEAFNGYDIAGTVALNDTMKHIYKKLNIREYGTN